MLPPITIFSTVLEAAGRAGPGQLYLMAIAVGRERVFTTEGWLDRHGELRPVGRDYVHELELPAFIEPQRALENRIDALCRGVFMPPMPMAALRPEDGHRIADEMHFSAVQLQEVRSRRWRFRSRERSVPDLYGALRGQDQLRGRFSGSTTDQFIHEMMIQPIMERTLEGTERRDGGFVSPPRKEMPDDTIDRERIERAIHDAKTADTDYAKYRVKSPTFSLGPDDPTLFDPEILTREMSKVRSAVKGELGAHKIRGTSLDGIWADEADAAAKVDDTAADEAEINEAARLLNYTNWGEFE